MLSGDGSSTLIKTHSERTVVDAINLVFEHSLQDTRVQVSPFFVALNLFGSPFFLKARFSFWFPSSTSTSCM